MNGQCSIFPNSLIVAFTVYLTTFPLIFMSPSLLIGFPSLSRSLWAGHVLKTWAEPCRIPAAHLESQLDFIWFLGLEYILIRVCASLGRHTMSGSRSLCDCYWSLPTSVISIGITKYCHPNSSISSLFISFIYLKKKNFLLSSLLLATLGHISNRKGRLKPWFFPDRLVFEILSLFPKSLQWW